MSLDLLDIFQSILLSLSFQKFIAWQHGDGRQATGVGGTDHSALSQAHWHQGSFLEMLPF